MSTPAITTPIPALRWRKSSRSGNNGSCVEVAAVTDPRQLAWLKSSRSANNGACVEVAPTGHAIAVRDSKNPDGPALLFCRDDWAAFLAGIRHEDFDLPA